MRLRSATKLAVACMLAAVTCSGCGKRAPTGTLTPLPKSFFGVNGQRLPPLLQADQGEELVRHLEAMRRLGISFVRANTGWRYVEPDPPGAGHRYELATTDAWVSALASHDLIWQPTGLGPTPLWAADPSVVLLCGSRSPPARPGDFAAMMAELARRYGRHGSLWEEYPGLPYRPVTDYEVWNEPNFGAFWCPEPDPEAYARLYEATRNAIHRVDPRARVLFGGLASYEANTPPGQRPPALAVPEFLSRVVAAEPGLRREVDAIAVHLYEPHPSEMLADLGWLRDAVDQAGLAGAPLAVNELGWWTMGQRPGHLRKPVPEQTRAQYMREATSRIARAGAECDVIALAPHAWVTDEQVPENPEDWFGIAEPATGRVYPTALAYGGVIELFEGRASEPPPGDTEEVCRPT